MNSERRSSGPFVFVLMPLRADLRDVYESGIQEACAAAGVYCERVDEQRYTELMLERIYNQIQSADIIVADMSERNPNVFYEVGYAHALNKRVILLTHEANDIPFDLRHHRHITYHGDMVVLKTELAEELRWLLRTAPPDVWTSGTIDRKTVRSLARVSKAVAGQLKLGPLLENIIDEVTSILDAEVCSIFLADHDDADTIKCVAGSGYAKAIKNIARYTAGEGFTGKVFQRAQTMIVSSLDDLEKLRQNNEFRGKYDALQWEPYAGRPQFRNCMACPLKIGERPIGVIKVENKHEGDFTPDDVKILEAISNSVLAVCIHNARLIDKLGMSKGPDG